MPSLRVLLADSDSVFRTNAQRALTRQGYFVIPAANGIDALNRLESDQVDIVVAEVALPERDGLEVLRAAKTRVAALPVILLTEVRMIGTAASGVREGAFDYLLKPLDDFTRLALLIDRAVGRVLTQVTAPEAPTGAPSGAGEQALWRLLDAAVAAQPLDALLTLYAGQLAELAHAAHAAVLLARGDGQLHLSAAHGYTDRVEAARAYVETVGDDFGWRVAAAREWVWYAPPAPAQEVAEVFGVPLLYGEQVLGVALAYATAPRASFQSAEVDAIRRLTQQAALAVELARVRAQAEQLRPTDPVTGLLNREHFLQMADREFRRSWRFGEPIAALQLDVDDFSKLHLMLGPRGSDELMRRVAEACRPRVRVVDVVGRLDADTVGVLLLMTTRDNALSVAERLRRAVAEIELATPEGAWQVTASIGIAVYPREQCTAVHDLLALAEQAARAAKRAGRNRVVAV